METLEFSELIFNDLKSTVETLEKCPCTFIWFFFIVYSKQVFAILNFFILSLYIKERAQDQSSFQAALQFLKEVIHLIGTQNFPKN